MRNGWDGNSFMRGKYSEDGIKIRGMVKRVNNSYMLAVICDWRD
jgi:hypothetical protein